MKNIKDGKYKYFYKLQNPRNEICYTLEEFPYYNKAKKFSFIKFKLNWKYENETTNSKTKILIVVC